MSTYRFVICTPTGKLFDQDVYYASVPSDEGLFGVMAGHETLVGLLGRGGICYANLDESGSQKKTFLIFKGGAQMMNGILTVLCAYGIDLEEMDKEKILERKAELETLMKEYEGKEDTHSKVRVAAIQRDIEWEDVQLEYLAKQSA